MTFEEAKKEAKNDSKQVIYDLIVKSVIEKKDRLYISELITIFSTIQNR